MLFKVYPVYEDYLNILLLLDFPTDKNHRGFKFGDLACHSM
jgi:hypothetical protein